MTVPHKVLEAARRLVRYEIHPDEGGMSAEEAVDYAFDPGDFAPQSQIHYDGQTVASWVVGLTEGG